MKNSCSFIIFHSMVKGAWKFDNGTAKLCYSCFIKCLTEFLRQKVLKQSLINCCEYVM